jgi:ssDNA-binding Zn-finger/Zn-ribbon topoisomerase 1
MTNSKIYTCAIHSGVHSDQPGNCPKCRMQLVPKQNRQTHHRLLKQINYEICKYDIRI